MTVSNSLKYIHLVFSRDDKLNSMTYTWLIISHTIRLPNIPNISICVINTLRATTEGVTSWNVRDTKTILPFINLSSLSLSDLRFIWWFAGGSVIQSCLDHYIHLFFILTVVYEVSCIEDPQSQHHGFCSACSVPFFVQQKVLIQM